MSKLQFTIVAVILAIGSAVFGTQVFKAADQCTQARAAAPTENTAGADVHLDLGVEIAGNTRQWQAEVATFIRGQVARLPKTVDARPARALASLTMFKGGEDFEITAGCGVDRFVIGPNNASLDEWETSDEGYRATLATDFDALRSRQVDAIVDTMVAEIATTSFGDAAPASFPMSPVPVLQAVSSQPSTSRTHRAAVLVAGASTTGDCMDPQDALGALPENPSPADLDPVADRVVAGCVQYGQLDLIETDDLVVVTARAANPSAMQKAWANALAQAVCHHAVAPTTTCTSESL